MTKPNLEDVCRSYRWLGHETHTELSALHPRYRPGKENFAWNRDNRTFPVTAYVRNAQDVVKFVRQHHDTRMVCYGLNDRPQAFKNNRGFPRAAKEHEIKLARNLLMDFDFEGKTPTAAQLRDAERFLGEAADYFRDLGLGAPEHAFTGRGYHLLFAYPAIETEKHPDLAERQRKFNTDFGSDVRQELSALELKIDSVQDLSRKAKIYGTAKPDVGIVSRFRGDIRVEDPELGTYLLGLVVGKPTRPFQPSDGGVALPVDGSLPAWFAETMRNDALTRSLWEGQGKRKGDLSRSGYDFSLVRRLLQRGHTDVSDLATILALRPNGAAHDGRADDYIARTIANALMK